MLHLVPRAVQAQAGEVQQKRRGIRPGQELELAPDTVGGDDLAGLEQLFHGNLRANTVILSIVTRMEQKHKRGRNFSVPAAKNI